MKETSLTLAISMLSFMMAVIWGGPLKRILRAFKIGKLIRVEGPGRHITKMGTPTMGGVMFILPVILITVLFNAASLFGLGLQSQDVFLPMVVLVTFGILGAIDDWEGVRGPRTGLGMRARTKFLLQTAIAIGIAFYLRDYLQVPQLFWPGVDISFNLGSL